MVKKKSYFNHVKKKLNDSFVILMLPAIISVPAGKPDGNHVQNDVYVYVTEDNTRNTVHIPCNC